MGLLLSHGPPGWQPANTTALPAGTPWVNESCTGELLSPDVVLTAGHCFDVGQGEEDANPMVRMDSFYVGQGTAIQSGDDNWEPAVANMQKYTVDAFVRPSGYAPSSTCPPSDLDIAVLHLATPVPGVTPLGIATSAPPVGASVTTIGFGRHPTSDGGTASGVTQCCVQTCVTDCTCLQNTCGCKNLSNFGGVCLCNDPTVADSYDQLVRRTATVTIAEVQTQYLHQTDVSQSTDLPGDSGGAVVYNGLLVGTDDCGNGCSDAQTDQYFVRMDVAHDWIVSQVTMFDGDAAAGGSGSSSGSSGAGSSGGGSSGASSSGSSSGSGGTGSGSSSSGAAGSGGGSSGSSGSATTSGGSTGGGSSSGVGFGGGSGSGPSSGSGSAPGAGSDGDAGAGDGFGSGAGSGSGCSAAGGPGSAGMLEGLTGLGLLVLGALARRSRRLVLLTMAASGACIGALVAACAGGETYVPGDDGGDDGGGYVSSSGSGGTGYGSSSGSPASSSGASTGSYGSSSGTFGGGSSGTSGTSGSSSGSIAGGSSGGASGGSTSGGGGFPGLDGGLPGLDGGIPGFDGSFPGWDGGIPGLDGGFPGLDGGFPGFDF